MGEEGFEWLTNFFNVIFKTIEMANEWRHSTIISLYKHKEDAQNCNNYRGIKLLSHAMKLWKMVIKGRLTADVRILENQFGFMSGGSTIEAIYLICGFIEFYRDRKRTSMWCLLTWRKLMIEYLGKYYGGF